MRRMNVYKGLPEALALCLKEEPGTGDVNLDIVDCEGETKCTLGFISAFDGTLVLYTNRDEEYTNRMGLQLAKDGSLKVMK